MNIASIVGHEIYDSRGWPTLLCAIQLEDGFTAYASVPTGLSRSKHEARELRDGDKRLWGKGVLKAIEMIEQVIAPEFVGQEPNAITMDFKMIEMDGSIDKSYLGANTMLAVSMALYRAQAHVEGIELYELIGYLFGAESITIPFPFFNVINGGAHAQNNLRIQEFMVVPVGVPTFRESMEIGVVVYQELKNALTKRGYSTAVGDEGGFSPEVKSDEEALDILTEVLEKVGDSEGNRCVIALDFAATQFYDKLTHTYNWQKKHLTSKDMIEVYEELVSTYPIYSIEDGLSEDDWSGWQAMKAALQTKVQLVADDLVATNIDRIARSIEEDCATSVIIKPNQIGTITETLQAIKLCKENNLNTIVSHRSGETEDSFIADIAIGSSAGQLKAGGPSRSERLAKYNRILLIEDMLVGSM